MPEAFDFCEVCRTAETIGGDHLCSDCQQFILDLKNSELFIGGGNYTSGMRLKVPIKTGYGDYGVPTLIEKNMQTKCILCANSTYAADLWCNECRDVFAGFSRAVGPWGPTEISRVMEGLRNVSSDTWEVFQMMADLGARDIIMAQLQEMHAGVTSDERDSE